MPEEIERKVRIHANRLQLPAEGLAIKQGYLPLSESEKTAVRVRVMGDEVAGVEKLPNR